MGGNAKSECMNETPTLAEKLEAYSIIEKVFSLLQFNACVLFIRSFKLLTKLSRLGISSRF